MQHSRSSWDMEVSIRNRVADYILLPHFDVSPLVGPIFCPAYFVFPIQPMCS